MKNVIYALLVLCAFSLPAFGQNDIEFNGGYQHASGDQGARRLYRGRRLEPNSPISNVFGLRRAL